MKKKTTKNYIEEFAERKRNPFTNSITQEYRKKHRYTKKEHTAIEHKNSNRTPELSGTQNKE